MLRIGFVGAGIIAWAHALGLQAMVEVGIIEAGITAVFDLDGDRAAGFAAVNGARAVGNLGQLLDACDAVYVCTPTADHPDVVAAAAVRGRAVFCEKPLAVDLAGAEALALAARGIPAQVGLVLRSTPVFGALRALVQSGELGAVMAAVFRDDQYLPIQGMYGSRWRADVRAAGGGCLIEHSIHDLDILRYCLGEVRDVTGRTANFAGHDGIEDVATATLRFESGATATLVSVWHGILRRGSTRRVEVFFERGLAWLDRDVTGPLHIETDDGVEARACPLADWVQALPLADDETGLAIRSYAPADRAFVDAVVDGRPTMPSLDEGVVAHRLVDAVYRSAGAGGVPVAV